MILLQPWNEINSRAGIKKELGLLRMEKVKTKKERDEQKKYSHEWCELNDRVIELDESITTRMNQILLLDHVKINYEFLAKVRGEHDAIDFVITRKQAKEIILEDHGYAIKFFVCDESRRVYLG